MRVGYTRVSTVEQNTDRQDLQDVERLFEDKATGGNTDRPALQKMLAFVREGDHIVIWSIDRLARSLSDLQGLIDSINAKGVAVKFVSERLTFSAAQDDPFARLQLHMMGAFAEFERSIIKKRQKEGIAKAKTKGKYKGRKPSIDRQSVMDLVDEGVPIASIAKRMGVSRPSVYRIMNEVQAA